MTGAPALEARGLVKRFPLGSSLFGSGASITAVDGVSLIVERGRTLGVVGESGCGKTTLGKLALRLVEPDAGEILLDGVAVTGLTQRGLRPYRRRAQMVFQDPFSSLNPRRRCGAIVAEPMAIHGLHPGRARAERVAELFEQVGLRPEQRTRFPHELSGGQRQRLGIARALALEPSLIIADEPVSALDVSVQAQVLNLMMDLQARMGLAYLFISHDLAVVEHIADRVAVMYLGRLVEVAAKRDLFAAPLHPYTEALLAAVPVDHPSRRRTRAPLAGDVPSPVNIPAGCAFHTRCPLAAEICRTATPPLRRLPDGRDLACHRRGDGAPVPETTNGAAAVPA